MSTLDVVAEVLREVAPRALRAREIAALAGARLPTASRTPETVVSRDLALEVKRNEARSRFLRAAPGEFLLKEALPTAFYSDNDAYVAQWTRNLAAAGEIAAGVVDERSIRDLKPADVASYRQCHFFAGIGTWSRALRDAGWPDDAAIWSGSCPCTDFSSAGKRRGFDGDFHLWPEWYRLIRECRPPVIVGEQTSSKLGRSWVDLVFDDLERIGYTCKAIDTPACSIGAPHRRQRLYFVAYSRQRGREILGSPWLHARRQSGDDAARRCSIDSGAAGPVSDAERVMRNEGRRDLAHGWAAIEPDRHGEVDGADDAVELGDTCLARGGRDSGEVPRAEGVGEGERIEARDLVDEPVASSAVDGAVGDESVDGEDIGMVRGAVDLAGNESDAEHSFRPGDRIRFVDDPTWGGAVRGFWAEDVEWIYCRPAPGHQDGCWRPAQSGNEPLASGTSADLGRTRSSRLRGYGNAIVRPQAVVFVEAVIDTFADAARELLPAVAVAPTEVVVTAAAAVPADIVEPADVIELHAMLAWTGPHDHEVAPSGMLYGRVPDERWPYGPPSAHQKYCNLFPRRGSPGGLFCDCAASAADDVEYGVGW